MKRKTLLLLFTVLLAPIAARAQTNQAPPATSGTIEDDPQFKRLPPEKQDIVRQMMDRVEKAANAQRAAQQTATPPAPAQPKARKSTPPAPNAQAGGCPADPRKVRFHVPKAVKGLKRVGDLTGINLDPNASNAPKEAPNAAPKDATGKPCPPVAAPAKPAGK